MRTICIGLCLILMLTLGVPVFAQNDENDFKAFEEDKNNFSKTKKGEEFISKHKTSARRPQIDLELIKLYNAAGTPDLTKVRTRVEDVKLNVKTTDSKTLAAVYEAGVTAMVTLGDLDKVMEYGDLAVQADPNNMTALLWLSYLYPRRLKGDTAAKTAQLNKAMSYAEKLQTLPRPAGMVDAAWLSAQARTHSNLGFLLFLQGKLVESSTEYEQALRINPKDHDGQFQLGVNSVALMFLGAAELQKANTAMMTAMTKEKNDKEVDELIAKVNSINKEVVEKRDLAIDSLATALAIGGDRSKEARTELERVYGNKNGSLTGIDELIAKKRADLPALTTAAAPAAAAAPAR